MSYQKENVLFAYDLIAPSETVTNALAPVFTLEAEQWEQLIRIVISLKNHVATAHLILQKLAARGSSDRVAKAVMELGKLIKTIYILHYLSNEELRRKVQLQLNHGETRHYLARHIFFANQGEFKTADYEEMMSIASCLSLLGNYGQLKNF